MCSRPAACACVCLTKRPRNPQDVAAILRHRRSELRGQQTDRQIERPRQENQQQQYPRQAASIDGILESIGSTDDTEIHDSEQLPDTHMLLLECVWESTSIAQHDRILHLAVRDFVTICVLLVGGQMCGSGGANHRCSRCELRSRGRSARCRREAEMRSRRVRRRRGGAERNGCGCCSNAGIRCCCGMRWRSSSAADACNRCRLSGQTAGRIHGWRRGRVGLSRRRPIVARQQLRALTRHLPATHRGVRTGAGEES